MHTLPIAFLELFSSQVQYVVPRWQRRYCWDQSDIERLVDDLLTVAQASADSNPAHYGGTLLTFPESRAAQPVTIHRVVDGQQRLTTVSILLSCIAEVLGSNGQCGEWTAQTIKNRLANPADTPPARLRKLRLQDGDEEEYRSGLEGNPQGPGAVAQAWGIVRKLVRKNDIAQLLVGLERLRVVSIGLGDHDDPQQIFESLNATGRPLTESEKLKNWLLMCLPDAEQQELHDRHWKRIEVSLDAEYSTDRIDTFLRDFLRWKTGEMKGVRYVYDDMRRWAVRNGKDGDRPSLCSELADTAAQYGILADTCGPHEDKNVERELRHIRALGLDTHRPMTLRLLCEAAAAEDAGRANATLAEVFRGVGTWITRSWLSARPLAGMNKAFLELAHGPGPADDEDPADFWLGRIRKFRNSRVEVPGDEAVREGIRTRKAYGGKATPATKAILCAMMEREQKGESPARGVLTVEHVMPQKLTDEWRRALGDDAERIHGMYRDRLANLTLSGVNAELGRKPFEEKREIMERGGIRLNRIIVKEDAWNEAALERRAEDLAERALDLWPWQDPDATDSVMQDGALRMRWRMDGGAWREEPSSTQMMLNVAGALLSRDAQNADRLRGDAVTKDLQLASRYSPDSKARYRLRVVPGHAAYLLCINKTRKDLAERCQEMGKQCGVLVDVEFRGLLPAAIKEFWVFLKKETGGLPGQSDAWRHRTLRTEPLNDARDRINVACAQEEITLYVKADEGQHTPRRAERMLRYSRKIRESMSDQEFNGNEASMSEKGRSISIRRIWDRDGDRDDWPEAAAWVKDQADRLQAIVETFDSDSG